MILARFDLIRAGTNWLGQSHDTHSLRLCAEGVAAQWDIPDHVNQCSIVLTDTEATSDDIKLSISAPRTSSSVQHACVVVDTVPMLMFPEGYRYLTCLFEQWEVSHCYAHLEYSK